MTTLLRNLVDAASLEHTTDPNVAAFECWLQGQYKSTKPEPVKEALGGNIYEKLLRERSAAAYTSLGEGKSLLNALSAAQGCPGLSNELNIDWDLVQSQTASDKRSTPVPESSTAPSQPRQVTFTGSTVTRAKNTTTRRVLHATAVAPSTIHPSLPAPSRMPGAMSATGALGAIGLGGGFDMRIGSAAGAGSAAGRRVPSAAGMSCKSMVSSWRCGSQAGGSVAGRRTVGMMSCGSAVGSLRSHTARAAAQSRRAAATRAQSVGCRRAPWAGLVGQYTSPESAGRSGGASDAGVAVNEGVWSDQPARMWGDESDIWTPVVGLCANADAGVGVGAEGAHTPARKEGGAGRTKGASQKGAKARKGAVDPAIVSTPPRTRGAATKGWGREAWGTPTAARTAAAVAAAAVCGSTPSGPQRGASRPQGREGKPLKARAQPLTPAASPQTTPTKVEKVKGGAVKVSGTTTGAVWGRGERFAKVVGKAVGAPMKSVACGTVPLAGVPASAAAGGGAVQLESVVVREGGSVGVVVTDGAAARPLSSAPRGAVSEGAGGAVSGRAATISSRPASPANLRFASKPPSKPGSASAKDAVPRGGVVDTNVTEIAPYRALEGYYGMIVLHQLHVFAHQTVAAAAWGEGAPAMSGAFLAGNLPPSLAEHCVDIDRVVEGVPLLSLSDTRAAAHLILLRYSDLLCSGTASVAMQGMGASAGGWVSAYDDASVDASVVLGSTTGGSVRGSPLAPSPHSARGSVRGGSPVMGMGGSFGGVTAGDGGVTAGRAPPAVEDRVARAIRNMYARFRRPAGAPAWMIPWMLKMLSSYDPTAPATAAAAPKGRQARAHAQTNAAGSGAGGVGAHRRAHSAKGAGVVGGDGVRAVRSRTAGRSPAPHKTSSASARKSAKATTDDHVTKGSAQGVAGVATHGPTATPSAPSWSERLAAFEEVAVAPRLEASVAEEGAVGGGASASSEDDVAGAGGVEAGGEGSEEAAWAATVQRRSRQIAIGKATRGAVVVDAITPYVHPAVAWVLPQAPDAADRVSKRLFVARCLHWRQRLKAFEAVDIDAAVALGRAEQEAGRGGIAPFGVEVAEELRVRAADIRDGLKKKKDGRMAVLRARKAKSGKAKAGAPSA